MAIYHTHRHARNTTRCQNTPQFKKLDEKQVNTRNIRKKAQEYIDLSPKSTSKPFADFWRYQVGDIDRNAKILEVGSGNGRLARFLEDEGRKVIRSDAVRSFIEKLEKEGTTFYINLLGNQEHPFKYDVVIAEAVLLHFNETELREALQNIKKLLSSDGVLIATFQQGEGEIVSTHKLEGERFFKFWKQQELTNFFEAAGFTVLDSGPGFVTSDKKWIFIKVKM